MKIFTKHFLVVGCTLFEFSNTVSAYFKQNIFLLEV